MLEALKGLFGRPRVRPAIRLTEDGFVVERGGRALSLVRWADVREVFAFKRGPLAGGRLCLCFRAPDAGGCLRVDEGMAGYPDLVEAMQRAFPGYDKGWWYEAAFPAFYGGRTTVWGGPPP
jgi:hypothetical protein